VKEEIGASGIILFEYLKKVWITFNYNVFELTLCNLGLIQFFSLDHMIIFYNYCSKQTLYNYPSQSLATSFMFLTPLYGHEEAH
jgi:hypothetical protein